MSFDANVEAAKVIRWARDFLKGTEGKPLVIGMSGGKDSTITAAALAEAVGPHRVLGVLMPNGEQKDLEVAKAACDFLQIQRVYINIAATYHELLMGVKRSSPTFKEQGWSDVVLTNAPARLRMNFLYVIANQLHGRVVNTCNMSETFVGYDTKWGDQCGDFGLFTEYTATEVKKMGYALGVTEQFVEKPPDDGMCGQTDEERWGFSYDYLDAWLRRGGGYENETDKAILEMHLAALHKVNAVALPHPVYRPADSHILYMNADCTRELLRR